MSPRKQMLILEALRELYTLMEVQPIEQSCVDCLHFNAGKCRKCNELIPADVLPNGCQEWEFIEVAPF